MELGIVVGGDLRRQGQLAAEAERAGFSTIWCAETARSAFVQASVIAQATARASIGTNIALAFPRSPMLTAMSARDLAELSDGRFILGLGTQVKRINEQRFSVPFEHPAARVAEAVEVIRECLSAFGGTPIHHRGRFYTITLPPFPGAGPPPGHIPIYLAAVNPLMAETAGRVADGVLGHPMTSPKYVREVLWPAVRRGTGSAGRDPRDVNVSTGVIVAISADRELARREAALQVGFYATTRTYRPVLAKHGFEERVEPLRRAFVRGDQAEMTELALPMVDALAIAGTPEDCLEHVTAYEGVADRVILGGSWVGPSEERQLENHRALVATFGGRSQ